MRTGPWVPLVGTKRCRETVFWPPSDGLKGRPGIAQRHLRAGHRRSGETALSGPRRYAAAATSTGT